MLLRPVLQVVLGGFLEGPFTAIAAEIVGGPLVLGLGCGRGVDLHAADDVVGFCHDHGLLDG